MESGSVFLGRYTLLEEIPAPAFARTFLATDENLDRRVEVTVLQPRFAGHAEFATRFVAEARKVMELEHPTISRIYDVGHDVAAGNYYVISEHVVGTPLGRYVRSQSVPVNESLALIESVFAGLSRAHERGIAHLAITPHSVVVTPSEPLSWLRSRRRNP